jgi:hypothetical protein
MSQVTLYLDDETHALMTQCAQASGVSKSRWVSDIIRQHATPTWSSQCLSLAGRFTDFPLRDDAPAASNTKDTPRIGF